MVNLKDETPGVAVFLGHLAPTIVGVALAFTVAGLWWLGMINGGELPDSIGSWGKLSIALIAWGVYCTPSGSDIKGALGR